MLRKAKRYRPLIDEKNYTVVWATGRRAALTRSEAFKCARKVKSDWTRFACPGDPNVEIWYRDGTLVES